MNNQNGFKELERLALFGTFLGCLNYSENLKQTTNDDLMVEMKHQNTDFMEKIIFQNERIIEMLTTLINSKGVE